MIKYKCRYMYDEWNCIVECIEKKTEYTILAVSYTHLTLPTKRIV